MVISEPALAENISPSKNGIGERLIFLQISIITGVKSKTTASLTKKAEAKPVIKVMITNNIKGVFAKEIVFEESKEKKPSNLRLDIISIIPKSKAKVLKSMLLIAFCGDKQPHNTIATAPTKAMLFLSKLTKGSLSNIIPI